MLGMLSLKYVAQTSLPGPMPKPEEVCIFRLTPVVKGWGPVPISQLWGVRLHTRVEAGNLMGTEAYLY